MLGDLKRYAVTSTDLEQWGFQTDEQLHPHLYRCTSVLSVTSLSCTPMPGQRLLTVQIESDGNVVYEGIRGVPDNTPVFEMWDVSATFDLNPPPVKATVQKRPMNARTLEGAVVHTHQTL